MMEKIYKDTTVYVLGHGKTSNDNAITSTFKIFFIGFVIDTENDEIVDLECSATIDITKRFVRDLFIGKTFAEYDSGLVEDVKRRYFGTSQKAIIIAYKDALKKYKKIKND